MTQRSSTALKSSNFPRLREFARLLDEQETASFAHIYRRQMAMEITRALAIVDTAQELHDFLEAVEDEARQDEFHAPLERLEAALQRGAW